MPQLLHLDSSADLTGSTSRELTALFADVWHGISPDHSVIRRDLHTNPLPHLPTSALHWAPRLRAPHESAPSEGEALQQELIDEVLSADAVVVGVPMYNWGVPSTLKAWLDYISVLGITMPLDEPAQPFAGKPIVVVSSRGNTYAPGTPGEGTDFVVPSLRQALGVALGMEVSVVIAELTLASRLAPLATMLPQAEASRTAARDAVVELAKSVGTRHVGTAEHA